MQKIGNTKDEKKDDEFESLNLDPSKQEDKLDKVADNVKKQENDAFNMPTQTDQTQTEMKTTEKTQEAQKGLKVVEHTSTQKESQAVAKKEISHKKPKATPKDKEAHKDKDKHAVKELKVKKEAHKEVPKKPILKPLLLKGIICKWGFLRTRPIKPFCKRLTNSPIRLKIGGLLNAIS